MDSSFLDFKETAVIITLNKTRVLLKKNGKLLFSKLVDNRITGRKSVIAGYCFSCTTQQPTGLDNVQNENGGRGGYLMTMP
jgi:hypothetical protein